MMLQVSIKTAVFAESLIPSKVHPTANGIDGMGL